MDHLKPALGKSWDHSSRNIDFIYLINLDQRPEKYEYCINVLSPYGINPYRFSAVNGWEELTLEDINDIGVKYSPGMDGGYRATKYPLNGTGTDREEVLEVMNTFGDVYFCGCLRRGAMGCTLSHVSVLKDAYDSGYETIWVMEDDIELLQDPRIIFDLIEELDSIVGPNGWDVLYTDYDHRNARGEYVPASGYARRPNYKPKNQERLYLNQRIGTNFRRVGARFGTHSMIIRRSGIEKLVNFFNKYQMYHPIDMDFHAPEEMRLFTVIKDVVSNKLSGESDIGKPTYKKNYQ